jgi:hypothetical protein
MFRNLPMLVVIVVAALGAARGRADEAAPSFSRLVKADSGNNAAPPLPETGNGLIRLQGNRTAVQLDVHRNTITEVLAALVATYGISYRSSIALDKLVDGRYTGPLGHVISRVLDGYNFVVTQKGVHLDVDIFEKSGDKAVASPMATVVRQHRVPVTTRISRNR